ncbi:MAG: alpha/beta fold hydrolase [Xanthobacteraceae bacterium]
MGEETDRLVTRGVSVRVWRAGTGPPLLFLHGAGGWPAPLPFFERLSRRYALTVPEHPCFGASDDPQWLRSVADLAMYYLDLLDQVYASPVHVIGHSLGGWTAAEAAVRNVNRIASLTLLAPAGIRVKGIPPGDNFIWSPEEAAHNRFHDQSFAKTLLTAPPPNEEQLDIELQTKLAAVKFGWEPRWLNPDLEKWLHRITVPTHVVWGREDKILPSAYAKLWGERVPGAQVSMIEACGHSPHVERSDLCADKVLAFLAGERP